MPTKTRILVTGATGHQGGAVAKLLLDHGHQVRAVTRNPDSPAAIALSARGAEVVVGDLTDRPAMEAAARGVNAVFSMGTPFQVGPAGETKQGVTVADAAKAAGAFLVYSSVGNADQKTGVPHFDSKYEVEKHIRRIGADATVVAPVAFMENLAYGAAQLKQGIFGSALTPGRRLAQISVRDIAAVAVTVLENPARYKGRRFEIGADEVNGEEVVRILSAVAGRPFKYFQLPLDVIRKTMGEDGALMYEWFEKVGYTVDRAMLAREFPDVRWTSFEAWAKTTVPSLLAG
jgi:uncharacterized protein YbjT (DUF2867 family)